MLKGFSQVELAKKLKKTNALVSYIERIGKLNKNTLTDIAIALGVSTNFIENYNLDNNSSYVPKIKKLPEYEQNEITKALTEEIEYLKFTLEQQWKLIFELTKDKKS